MLRAIILFYIICLSLYIFFTRLPDYQDGELTTGIIHYIKDSTGKRVAKAVFSAAKMQDTIAADYSFRYLKEGQTVKIIYETSDPSKAAVYSWWGYWLQWDEILASLLIPLLLFYAAKAITAGPTPEAVVEELEMHKPSERKKYD